MDRSEADLHMYLWESDQSINCHIWPEDACTIRSIKANLSKTMLPQVMIKHGKEYIEVKENVYRLIYKCKSMISSNILTA